MRAGRGPLVEASDPPTEFLVLERISAAAVELLLLSGRDAMDDLELLNESLADVRPSFCEFGGVKWASTKDRRKRLALSRGPASFSKRYELLVLERRRSDGSGATCAI
jgi:hypothetical protein